jgi:uroporphyrinogen III methyltransferase/synthase
MAAADCARACLVLVTRPGPAGQRLSSELRARGQGALWWPAFDLLAPDDLEPLHELLQRLDRFDLVVFVSAAAVRGLAALDGWGPWPRRTAIAAPGAGTLGLARSLLPGAAEARGIVPAFARSASAGEPSGGVSSGSEALWEALRVHSPTPRQALIVRAESGREWLGERLRETGCQVAYASVYRRVVHSPSPEQRAALAAAFGAGLRAASVVTSSEAVAALDRQLAEAPGAKGWVRQGLALSSHPRIGEALRAAGYGEVRPCEPTADGVMDALVTSDAGPPAEAQRAKAGAR